MKLVCTNCLEDQHVLCLAPSCCECDCTLAINDPMHLAQAARIVRRAMERHDDRSA